jgi:enolase
MSRNNKELCDFIKDAISFIKNKRSSEAIVSLQTASSKLPDTDQQYEASDIIKWVIKMLEAEDTGAALHVMQAVINTTGYRHLQLYG